jgi:hypothetical protein
MTTMTEHPDKIALRDALLVAWGRWRDGWVVHGSSAQAATFPGALLYATGGRARNVGELWDVCSLGSRTDLVHACLAACALGCEFPVLVRMLLDGAQ